MGLHVHHLLLHTVRNVFLDLFDGRATFELVFFYIITYIFNLKLGVHISFDSYCVNFFM